MKMTLVDLSVDGFSAYPFGLYALKAYLHAADFDCDVSVVSFSKTCELETMLARIEADNPDVLGITCYVWNETQVYDLARETRLRDSATFILLGGPQIERSSASVAGLLETGVIDAAVVGEGEQPLLAILREIEATRRVPADAPGTAVMHEGSVLWGSETVLPKDIDYLPNPYPHLPDLRAEVSRTGVVLYETSRGCPYQCTFCDQGIKNFRSHTMSRIKQDLTEILALKPATIVFLDSTFNVSPGRTKEILHFLIDSGVTAHIEAEIKPERCDPETVELMRIAGFESVEVGLQSVKNETLDFIKRGNNFEKIAQSAEMLMSAGIEVNIDTIIGLPGESLDDWLDTVDFCYGLGDVRVLSNTLKVLPNTELKEDVRDRGFVIDKSRSYGVISTDTMSKDDILEARLHHKMIKVFWNRADDRPALRAVIDAKFDGRLTSFTRELIHLVARGVGERDLRDLAFWHSYERPRVALAAGGDRAGRSRVIRIADHSGARA